MPVVAFEVLSATAHAAARKPAAPADREGSTPFADMLDKTDKPAAKAGDKASDKAAKDTTKDTGKDAASAQQQPAPMKGEHHHKGARAEKKAKDTDPSDTTDAATIDPVDDGATADVAADQDPVDAFLTAVADAAGVAVSSPDTGKTETKSDDTTADTKSDKADDKSDDATAVAAPVVADVKPAPVAAAIAVPAETTTGAASAESTTASAALTVAVAEQGIAKAAAKADAAPADIKTDSKADTKADKPQAAPKLDTAQLLTQPATDGTKQTSNAQPAQPQQPQPAQKPATEAAAPAAKPAQHDAPAPDATATLKPADTLQPLQLAQSNTLGAPQNLDQTATTATPAPAQQAPALPVQGIAIDIASSALEGKKSFDIRLDPPELGKIHVRLDVDHKGEISSIITADRQDTFDLLRRDAQSLERALNDAGVKTSSSGLQFSLRDQGQQNAPQQFADNARVVVRDDTLDTEIIAPVYRPLAGNRAGLDIRV